MGSEMCIRDSAVHREGDAHAQDFGLGGGLAFLQVGFGEAVQMLEQGAGEGTWLAAGVEQLIETSGLG